MKTGHDLILNTIQGKRFSTVLLILGVVGSILIVSMLNTFISYHLTEDEVFLGVEVSNINPHFSLTDHNPINIDGNGAFHSLAQNESWPGDGSLESPYIITGFNITNSTGSSAFPLVEIRNTNLYFNLSFCIFEGGSYGLALSNVTNALIQNNTIRYSLGDYGEGDGIVLNSCSFNEISNNTINGHEEFGIALSNSRNITIRSNYFIDNGDGGITLSSSNNNTLSSNNITSNGRFAIILTSSNNNTVSDNIIIDHGYSIYISSNCQYNLLLRNIIDQNGEFGIRLTDSSNNTIVSNKILQNGMGMFIDSSPKNTFKDNEITYFGLRIIGDQLNHLFQTAVTNNSVNSKPIVYWQNINGGTVPDGAGQIILVNCSDVSIINQEFYNLEVALALDYCKRLMIQNNKVFNSSYNGVLLRYSNSSTLIDNYVQNTDGEGLVLAYSEYNTLIGNSIVNNAMIGCTIGYSSHSTLISNNIHINSYGCYILSSTNISFSLNIFENNSEYAIYLSSSENSLLTQNDFLFNKQTGGSQSYDSQTNPTLKNIFEYNYWNDWIVPDNDLNRIVDQPYSIDGPANNQDLYPLTVPYSQYVHTLTDPFVVYPNGGEILSDMITIQWTPSIDSWDHNVRYTLYYSKDGGTTWILLQADLTKTSYEWDTNTVPDGTEYLIHVVVNCSEGLNSSDYSNSQFYIENQRHRLSIPQIVFPKSGDIVSGEILVQWITAIDSWNHPVSYRLYYSPNNGSNWILIASNLTSNSYNWNLLSLDEGSSYLLKLITKCVDGLTSVDISDNVFSITTIPHSFSDPIIISPNGGETLKGSTQIQWSEAEDSLNHTVTYSIYFSFNNGITWFEIATGLTSCTFTWDTTSVADGSNYLIKVKAMCNQGLIVEDSSDDVFTIQNIIPASTIIPITSLPDETTKTVSTTSTSTTVSTASSSTTATTTATSITSTTSKPGNFPNILSVLVFIFSLVVAIRRQKNT
ncbi:MAG: right-handed parallel beta-helix repeat-containing protein [Candidatus Hodarchaeota archaeon]